VAAAEEWTVTKSSASIITNSAEAKLWTWSQSWKLLLSVGQAAGITHEPTPADLAQIGRPLASTLLAIFRTSNIRRKPTILTRLTSIQSDLRSSLRSPSAADFRPGIAWHQIFG